jgi:aldehyde dehydrogenase (NAD+)
MASILIEEVSPVADISSIELFGPVACLYRAASFSEALDLANRFPYGLTACIHTRSLHRAIEVARRVQSGVAVVNGGAFGSEPHMPFGGGQVLRKWNAQARHRGAGCVLEPQERHPVV